MAKKNSNFEMVMKILKEEKKKYDSELKLAATLEEAETSNLAEMEKFSLYSDEEFNPHTELVGYSSLEKYDEGGFNPEWN
jgi:hypothetical protein